MTLGARAVFASALMGALVAFHGSATAHEGNDPDAHQSMPNQVTAGGGLLCGSRFSGHRTDKDGDDEDISGPALPCAAIDIGFAREIGRWFDIRFRLGYQKPLAENDDLFDTLHEFRSSVAPELLVYGWDQRFTFTLGVEAGFEAALLNAIDDGPRPFEKAWATGFEIGVIAGFRGWVTYHTGFWAEVGFGHAMLRGDLAELDEDWVGKLELGWGDRF